MGISNLRKIIYSIVAMVVLFIVLFFGMRPDEVGVYYLNGELTLQLQVKRFGKIKEVSVLPGIIDRDFIVFAMGEWESLGDGYIKATVDAPFIIRNNLSGQDVKYYYLDYKTKDYFAAYNLEELHATVNSRAKKGH